MSNLQPVNVNLTNGQREMLNTALKNNQPVILKIRKGGQGNEILYLTNQQIDKLNKAKLSSTINLSKKQVKQMTTIGGQFFLREPPRPDYQ